MLMTMKIGMEMKMESTFTFDGVYSLIDLHITSLYLYDFLAIRCKLSWTDKWVTFICFDSKKT